MSRDDAGTGAQATTWRSVTVGGHPVLVVHPGAPDPASDAAADDASPGLLLVART